MSIELKPCPFCGADPATNYFGSEGVFPQMACVVCINEECASRPEVWGESEEAAAEAWNTRAERTCRAIPHDNLNESDGMGDAWEVCSECGALLAVITDNQPTPNYCPNCGAKVVNE